jgi:hypothetical protein
VIFSLPQQSIFTMGDVLIQRAGSSSPAPPAAASVIFFSPQQSPYVFGLAIVRRAPPGVLIINRPLHSVVIRVQSEPTPWSIDPERTQQIE